MRSASIRYGVRGPCRFGGYHDPQNIADTKDYKLEKCRICGVRKRWNKGYKGRIDNVGYIQFHVRNVCQPNGSTKRVYAKIYKPESLTIYV